MAKVSIIVPVYNAEKVLSHCIDSILNQSYKDFEVILINDGSRDGSIEILREYEKLDSRVMVIDNENNGVSETRNIGMIQAVGEYIQFVDSDDFIERDMLEKTIALMEKESSDIVMTGIFLDIEGKNGVDTSIQTFEGNISKDKKNIAQNVLERLNGTYINSPVNKLYKRSLIIENNISMNQNIDLGEDLIFNLDYLKYCNCVVFAKESYYHYCMKVEDNLTFKYRSDKLELMEVLFKKCKDYFNESDLDKYEIKKLNALFIKWMYSCYIDLNNKNCNLSFKKKYKYIKLSIKKYRYIVDDVHNLSTMLKVLKLTFISPVIVIIVSKIIYFIKTNLRKILYK
jgi:glycosyltransferase involved in cell wall biosynthesis